MPLLALATGVAAVAVFGYTAWSGLAARNLLPDLNSLLMATVALIGGGLALYSLWRLKQWPTCRLGLFRDRFVVIAGRAELHTPWERIESATLVEPLGPLDDWSELRIGDRLTITLRPIKGRASTRPLAFRPVDFGLEPQSCRDLILRLRDERTLRERLPDFDSALDLSVRPVVSGELITPRR